MEPMVVIMWAVCLGLGWIMFASITGADEWLRSRLGTSRTRELEERLNKLESRFKELEKHKAA
jgi:hypothetical protein